MCFFLCIVFFLVGDIQARAFSISKYIQLPCAAGKCKVASGLIYVRKQDKTLVNMPFGYADYLEQKPFTSHTQIYIGSIKKQFIAAAIMKLMNEGRVDLSAPISKYVKFNTGFPAHNPAWIHATTVHHLLSHISGVSAEPSKNIGELRSSLVDCLYVNSTLPSAPPKFAYSTNAYNLLEIAIENIIGGSFAEYIQYHFLTPLNMSDTFFS
jgi:CubicO group peptidase (beta-lactamase class C family)